MEVEGGGWRGRRGGIGYWDRRGGREGISGGGRAGKREEDGERGRKGQERGKEEGEKARGKEVKKFSMLHTLTTGKGAYPADLCLWDPKHKQNSLKINIHCYSFLLTYPDGNSSI